MTTTSTLDSYKLSLLVVVCLSAILILCGIYTTSSIHYISREVVMLHHPENFNSLVLNCKTTDQSNEHSPEFLCKPIIGSPKVSPGVHSIAPDTTESENSKPNKTVTDNVNGYLEMEYPRSRSQNSNGLLTLFTTFKETGNRQNIHRNTLKNWKALSPDVSPVLFVSHTRGPEGWPTEAKEMGWDVIATPYLKDDFPILKKMFEMVKHKGYDTPFVGYANADVLFDGTLMETLKSLRADFDTDNKQILITGKRKDVQVTYIQSGDCMKCIEELAYKTEFYRADAQDYFIFSRAGYPWDKVPDFVVGLPGFDNWLVAMTQRWDLALIDASYTITALHQDGDEGKRTGFTLNADYEINHRMAPGFNYEPGHTYCAKLKTVRSYNCLSGQIQCVKVMKRFDLEIPSGCKNFSSSTPQ